MSEAQELVFELLLISTGAKQSLTHSYCDKDWEAALDIANEQAILGVLLDALVRIQTVHGEGLMVQGSFPSKMLLLQLAVSLSFIYLCPNTVLAHWIYLVAAGIVLVVAYVLFKKKYYHLHEEYLASLKK